MSRSITRPGSTFRDTAIFRFPAIAKRELRRLGWMPEVRYRVEFEISKIFRTCLGKRNSVYECLEFFPSLDGVRKEKKHLLGFETLRDPIVDILLLRRRTPSISTFGIFEETG